MHCNILTHDLNDPTGTSNPSQIDQKEIYNKNEERRKKENESTSRRRIKLKVSLDISRWYHIHFGEVLDAREDEE